MRRAALLVALIVAAFGGSQPSAQAGELALILSGLAERTQQYYDRFISIICTETVHQQDLRYQPQADRKTAHDGLRAERLARSATRRARRCSASIGRCKLSMAARRERISSRDVPIRRRARPSRWRFCSRPISYRYRFTIADDRAGGPAGTRAMDFIETPSSARARQVGRQLLRGRRRRLPGTCLVRSDFLRRAAGDSAACRSHSSCRCGSGMSASTRAIRVERSEMTIRFSRVEFQQPDEVVLLPESIDTLTVFRGAPSLKTEPETEQFPAFPHQVRDQNPIALESVAKLATAFASV